MAYLKAAIAITFVVGLYASRSFIDCNFFQTGCFVVQDFYWQARRTVL